MFILSKNIYGIEEIALLAKNISLDEFKILTYLRNKNAIIAMKAINKEVLRTELVAVEGVDTDSLDMYLMILNRLGLIFLGDKGEVVVSKDGINIVKAIEAMESKARRKEFIEDESGELD